MHHKLSEWEPLRPDEQAKIAEAYAATPNNIPAEFLVKRTADGNIELSARMFNGGGLPLRWALQRHPGVSILATWSDVYEVMSPLFRCEPFVEVYPRPAQLQDTHPIRWFWHMPEVAERFSLAKHVLWVHDKT